MRRTTAMVVPRRDSLRPPGSPLGTSLSSLLPLGGVLILASLPAYAGAGPNAIPGRAAFAPATPTPDPAWLELKPMVVTATGHPAAPVDLPQVIDVVDTADLARTLPRTTPEALRELPSVMLQKTSHGQASPYLRGFTGFRTLMLVDGIRLNNSTFRDGPNQYWGTIDGFALDRLEIVRGPSSVLYGSDAIGGTVNAFSRGRSQFGPLPDADARGFYRFASAEDSHIGRAELSGHFNEHLGVHAGFTLKEFGDLRAGDAVGVQSHTGYDEWDADARIQYLFTPNSRLVFGHQTVDQDDAWRAHSTIYGVRWEGTVPGTDLTRINDQFRNLDYLRYEVVQLGGFVERIQATVSYQVQDEDESRLRGDRRLEVQGTYVDTLGASVQLESPTSVGRWVYGVEYYRDWVDSAYERYASDGTLQLRRIQGPVADDSSYDLLGAYAQDQIPLYGDRIELIAGARYNLAAADVGQAADPATGLPLAFEDSWQSLVGSARALWHVEETRRWTVFGGVSQGFRAPNLSDLSRFDLADRGEIEVPVFDLEPEKFLSFEGGLRHHQGPLTAEVAYHHTLIRDLIVRYRNGETAPTGEAVVMKKNSGDGFVHGVELSAWYRLADDWLLWGNFTWMEGTLETPTGPVGPLVTEPLSRLMPPTVNVGLRWEPRAGKYWAEFASTIAGTQDRLSSADERDLQRIPPGGTPGYEVFHLRAGWRPVERFTLSAVLENLTDTEYRIHGSGLNEAGLNFIIAADLRF